MWYLTLSIIALGIVTALIGHFGSKKKAPPSPVLPPPACCGQHDVCERNNLLAAASKPAEYYDDEDLDRFAGTSADAYAADAVEEFREVLYTLRTPEVASWLRSLQLRRIDLPDALKDEAYLIVGEQQTQN
ncbi:MAG: phospholipase [Tannerellaceae bacterium]|jgi:hypothetical protein|nr:phospholipase [Tannerellaceae bacterium]